MDSTDKDIKIRKSASLASTEQDELHVEFEHEERNQS